MCVTKLTPKERGVLLYSKKFDPESLPPLMKFQTSFLVEGEAGSLLNFSTRIFTGARNHGPRLIYPFVYILSAFFSSSRLSSTPSAGISTCNNPLESGETTNIRRVYPRQRQRRVIMHVPNAMPAFKQPSSPPRWQTITTVSSRLRGTNASAGSAWPIYRRQSRCSCNATLPFKLTRVTNY